MITAEILKPILENIIGKEYKTVNINNPFKELEMLFGGEVYYEYLEESDDREYWKQYQVTLTNDYDLYVVTVKDKIECVNVHNDKSEMVLGHSINGDNKYYFSEIFNREWLDYLGE